MKRKKYGLVQAFKLLVKNKFYLMICGTYILQQLYSAMIGAGIYYMTWVLKNKNLFGQFAWAVNIPLIIALIFTPTLVGKWNGMYKLNLRGYILAVIGRALVVVAGYMGSIPLMMAFTALAALGQGPWQGDMNAVIASCSEYTYLTQGKHVEGTMYSCTSLGVKIGGGIGTAVVGWLLELSGYVGTHAVQPQSALNMMQFMYLWLPLIFDVLIMFILSRMNVEETNVKIKRFDIGLCSNSGRNEKEQQLVWEKEVLGQVTRKKYLLIFRASENRQEIGQHLEQFTMCVKMSECKKEVAALRENRFGEFLRLVKESGDSSYKYLQNVYVCHDVEHQNVSIALAVSDMILGVQGANRVHGGGFAGTIQAFVPNDIVTLYKTEMEKVFGDGACDVLKIRKYGGIQVM